MEGYNTLEFFKINKKKPPFIAYLTFGACPGVHCRLPHSRVRSPSAMLLSILLWFQADAVRPMNTEPETLFLSSTICCNIYSYVFTILYNVFHNI